MKRVLMPLPSRDFDPTESGAPWRVLVDGNVQVVFATPDGRAGQADPWMLGEGRVRLGPFGPVLIADPNGRAAYGRIAASSAFQHPIRYADIAADEFDGLVLPGGHAPGMKEYLESRELQARVGPFFAARKPIGAICHGVVLAARCQREGRSVLDGYDTTALTARMEMFAWNLTKHVPAVGDYYRTYPETVQEEVTRAVGTGRFLTGPEVASSEFPALRPTPAHRRAFLKKIGLLRDRPNDDTPAFTVEHDGHYVSARWPGDAFTFARRFLAILNAPAPSAPTP